jgi:hypothetical protein
MVIENTGIIAFLRTKGFKEKKCFVDENDRVVYDFDCKESDIDLYKNSEFLMFKRELDSIKQEIKMKKTNRR